MPQPALHKRSAINPDKWLKWFFYVENRSVLVFYRHSKEGPKRGLDNLPQGTISLKNALVAEFFYSMTHPFCVLLVTPTRIYYLSAPSEERQKEWLKEFVSLHSDCGVELFDGKANLIRLIRTDRASNAMSQEFGDTESDAFKAAVPKLSSRIGAQPSIHVDLNPLMHAPTARTKFVLKQQPSRNSATPTPHSLSRKNAKRQFDCSNFYCGKKVEKDSSVYVCEVCGFVYHVDCAAHAHFNCYSAKNFMDPDQPNAKSPFDVIPKLESLASPRPTSPVASPTAVSMPPARWQPAVRPLGLNPLNIDNTVDVPEPANGSLSPRSRFESRATSPPPFTNNPAVSAVPIPQASLSPKSISSGKLTAATTTTSAIARPALGNTAAAAAKSPATPASPQPTSPTTISPTLVSPSPVKASPVKAPAGAPKKVHLRQNTAGAIGPPAASSARVLPTAGASGGAAPPPLPPKPLSRNATSPSLSSNSVRNSMVSVPAKKSSAIKPLAAFAVKSSAVTTSNDSGSVFFRLDDPRVSRTVTIETKPILFEFGAPTSLAPAAPSPQPTTISFTSSGPSTPIPNPAQTVFSPPSQRTQVTRKSHGSNPSPSTRRKSDELTSKKDDPDRLSSLSDDNRNSWMTLGGSEPNSPRDSLDLTDDDAIMSLHDDSSDQLDSEEEVDLNDLDEMYSMFESVGVRVAPKDAARAVRASLYLKDQGTFDPAALRSSVLRLSEQLDIAAIENLIEAMKKSSTS